MAFEDSEPAAEPGKQLWYRVAAVARSGRASPLSAPVRAVFTPPRPPSRGELGDSVVGSCTPTIEQTPIMGALLLGQDLTGRAAFVQVSCPAYSVWRPLAELVEDGYRAAPALDATACEQLRLAREGEQVTIRYSTIGGRLPAQISLPWLDSPCSALGTRLVLDCEHLSSVRPGQPVEPPVWVDAHYTGDGCVGVYLAIGG